MEGKEPQQGMKKRLGKNLALKIASFLLAFVLWFLIVQINDPKDTRTFSNIQVRLTNTDLLDKENKVYEVLDGSDTVRVTVRAPKSVIGQMRSSDIVAEADVSRLTDINTVPISYNIPNVDSDSVEGNHESVQLKVENKQTKWIDVTYSTTGEVAEGYMIASVTPDQNRIEVSGAESVIDTVSYAGVVIDVAGATRDLSANVEIEFYDSEGNLLDHSKLSTNVNYVHMAVEVLATKTVPIEINYTGEPEDGYILTGVVTCDPAEVQIAGRLSAVEAASKITVPEEKVNIAGATSDVVRTISIRDCLPENTRLADTSFSGRISVTVGVEAVAERNLDIRPENIRIINVPESAEVELANPEERYSLTVSGLNEDVAALQAAAITGTLDIGAWMSETHLDALETGVYTIPLQVELGSAVEVKNRVLVQVSVTIPQE